MNKGITDKHKLVIVWKGLTIIKFGISTGHKCDKLTSSILRASPLIPNLRHKGNLFIKR